MPARGTTALPVNFEGLLVPAIFEELELLLYPFSEQMFRDAVLMNMQSLCASYRGELCCATIMIY